ncbi:hypothetical protein Q427_19005 [Halomonas sp. BC04]|nr:hypothetical protein Q427_19005 [Halomonas sp. BC04]
MMRLELVILMIDLLNRLIELATNIWPYWPLHF